MSLPVREELDDALPAEPRLCPPCWRMVARRRVYFGHQSVGRDIIGGLEALNHEHRLGLHFVQTRSPSMLSGPAFVDFLAGENTRPATKNRALLQQLDARQLPDDAIAMLKYCYVDIGADTDVARVFDDYRRTVDAVRSRHPDVTVVHVAVPITSVEGVAKARIKKLLGRPSLRAANARRHEYNALLRRAFSGSEPVFDLAAVEAFGAAGAGRAGGSERLEALDPAFTHDGGHLNALGARTVAAAMLDVLGALAPRDAG